MIGNFSKRWRESRAKAAAERADLDSRFQAFLRETEPFVPPGSKYPRVALYRHAWRRAAVLGIIYQHLEETETVRQYKEYEKLAGEHYFNVAPETLYGQAPLALGEKAGVRLFEMEKQRLFPGERKNRGVRPLACIYLGTCEQGRVYVGQTIGPPEQRWVQHRFACTGPFKKGEPYVTWSVAAGNVDPGKLNELESYYIGYYDSAEAGYNDTKGNNFAAYARGRADRHSAV